MSEIILVYDGECPFCSSYTRLIRLREDAGCLRLINARENPAWQSELELADFNIDDGMVLKTGSGVYHGADAMHVLALLSSRSAGFNRFNAFVFGSSWRARLLYPPLRFGRNVTLCLLGKERMNSA